MSDKVVSFAVDSYDHEINYRFEVDLENMKVYTINTDSDKVVASYDILVKGNELVTTSDITFVKEIQDAYINYLIEKELL